MQAQVLIDANRVTFRVTGSLSFADNKEWRVVATEFLDKDGSQHLLDMTGLEDVDSAGLGMMLAMRKWAEDRNRDLKLKFDPDSFTGSMLRLAKFDEMFSSINS